MIKAVFFDIDNTLYDYDAANRKALAALSAYAREALGIGEEEFSALHHDMLVSMAEEMGEVAASHNRLIRYQRILEKKGLPLSPHLLRMTQTYWETFLEDMVPYAGAVGLMKLLKENGVRVGICTNMTAMMQVRKLEKLGLLPFVDLLVTSEEAGTEKPRPEIFALSIRKAGCAPGECLMVGDSPKHDIEGALAAGMKALLLVPADKAGKKEVPPGVPVIADLMEAAGYILAPGGGHDEEQQADH